MACSTICLSCSAETITTGLRWRAVQEPLICKGAWQPAFVDQLVDQRADALRDVAGGLALGAQDEVDPVQGSHAHRELLRMVDEVGGFSLEFPGNYNDVDYCMKLRHTGYDVVYVHGWGEMDGIIPNNDSCEVYRYWAG